ncbi:CML13 [Symbiodinium sp. KB8]|nr:CML13 [Symbiodinium sp. KB8]
MASLAKPPEAIPDAYANEVTKLHTSVATLFARKQIPYSVQAALAQEGYVTLEDIADRWDDPAAARTNRPRTLGFESGTNGFTEQSSAFTGMRLFQAAAKDMTKNLYTPRSCVTPGQGSSERSGLEALCDRQQLLTEWTKETGLPKPKLEAQGSDALLKTQFRFCSKGEVGFINAKYIVSALPELEEKPFKTRRKVTVDGWDKEEEEEEEEEERKLPTTRRHLDRMHRVFRNNLSMCLLAFSQFSQFDVSKQDLDDWYDWFWGPDIAGRTPTPSEKTLLYAERNAWRSIHNLVFEGKSLKEAMLEIRADALFWTREVYERVPRPGEKGTKDPLKGDKGDKGRQFARLPGKGPWKGKQPWPTYQPVFQPFLKENGKGKDTPGKKGDHKGKGKAPLALSKKQAERRGTRDRSRSPPGDRSKLQGMDPIRIGQKPANSGPSDDRPATLGLWIENHYPGCLPPSWLQGVPDRLVDKLKWSPDCSAAQVPGDAIVMPFAGKAASLEAILHAQASTQFRCFLELAEEKHPSETSGALETPQARELSREENEPFRTHAGDQVRAHASGLGDFIKRKALPLVPDFLASTASGAKQHPFPDSVLKEIRDFILPKHSQPDAGQPFFLDVIHTLLKDIQDMDSGYPVTLKEGVPLGVDTPTLKSPGVWLRPTANVLKKSSAHARWLALRCIFASSTPWPDRNESFSKLTLPRLIGDLCLLTTLPGCFASPVNTWLGFVIDPKGPCVQMARDKHLLVMGILEDLSNGKVMSASQIASALGAVGPEGGDPPLATAKFWNCYRASSELGSSSTATETACDWKCHSCRDHLLAHCSLNFVDPVPRYQMLAATGRWDVEWKAGQLSAELSEKEAIEATVAVFRKVRVMTEQRQGFHQKKESLKHALACRRHEQRGLAVLVVGRLSFVREGTEVVIAQLNRQLGFRTQLRDYLGRELEQKLKWEDNERAPRGIDPVLESLCFRWPERDLAQQMVISYKESEASAGPPLAHSSTIGNRLMALGTAQEILEADIRRPNAGKISFQAQSGRHCSQAWNGKDTTRIPCIFHPKGTASSIAGKAQVLYSDNAHEFDYAAKQPRARHNTSREHCDENKAATEHEIRTVPSELRFGEKFIGKRFPFGANVLYWVPVKNFIKEGWDLISSVIDMDLREVMGSLPSLSLWYVLWQMSAARMDDEKVFGVSDVGWRKGILKTSRRMTDQEEHDRFREMYVDQSAPQGAAAAGVMPAQTYLFHAVVHQMMPLNPEDIAGGEVPKRRSSVHLSFAACGHETITTVAALTLGVGAMSTSCSTQSADAATETSPRGVTVLSKATYARSSCTGLPVLLASGLIPGHEHMFTIPCASIPEPEQELPVQSEAKTDLDKDQDFKLPSHAEVHANAKPMFSSKWERAVAYHHGLYVPEKYAATKTAEDIRVAVADYSDKVHKDSPKDACKYLQIEEFRCLNVHQFESQPEVAAKKCMKWWDEVQKCQWDQAKFNAGTTYIEGPQMRRRRAYIFYPDFKYA